MLKSLPYWECPQDNTAAVKRSNCAFRHRKLNKSNTGLVVIVSKPQTMNLPAKHFKEAFQVNLSDPLVNVGTVNSPNAHLTLILRLGEREHHYAQECLYL
jgi:hypothetical protein